MTTIDIKAIGSLLMYYESDLMYIREFQRYIRNEIRKDDFGKGDKGVFYNFTNEFRVTRNFPKGRITEVLTQAKKWIDGSTPNDVDGFAKQLNMEGLTHGKTMTVLASKILFLNNPWEILPMDIYTKTALGLKDNGYANYISKIEQVKKALNPVIDERLSTVEPYLKAIEEPFKKEIKPIKSVRQNRYIDKLLWTIGASKQKFFEFYHS